MIFRYAKSFFGSLAPILLLGVIALSQYYYDVQRRAGPLVPPTIIPAQVIRMADLGLHAGAASLMWIYTIQQMGDDIDNKLPDFIANVNAIDPKFSYPYAFAALVLPPLSKSPEKAIEIAERGIRDADPDWRIPYYLATTYHIFLHDREKAAFYFDLAARTPGAVDKIKSIARLYGTYASIREQTKQVWISIWESSGDELVKEQALKYIAQIDILDALDKAVLIYRQRYGRYPWKIEDLVTGKIIKEIPESPLGSEFQIKDGKIFVR